MRGVSALFVMTHAVLVVYAGHACTDDECGVRVCVLYPRFLWMHAWT